MAVLRRLLLVLGIAAILVPAAAARTTAVGISSISPREAARGAAVTIAGNGFGGPNVRVTVGGEVAKVLSATGSSARFLVPSDAPFGATTVTATNPGGQSGSIAFRVLFDGVVQPVADATAAVTKTVGPGGGTVSAGAATLTIPPGGLADDEQITVTPLRSLDGSPFDQLLGGVKLGPDGLTFIKPATLTIQLPPGFDPAQLLGFEFDGAGTDFHLVPAQLDGSTLSISIWHFSGGGAVSGGASAVSTMLRYTPTRTAYALEQAIAIDINQLVSFGIRNAGPAIALELELWYDETVGNGLQAAAAAQDQNAYEQAIGEWQAWLTNVQLYGDLPGTAPFSGATVHDVLLSRITQAATLATNDSAAIASATLDRCTGVDFLSPLKTVFRLGGILEVLGVPVAGMPASGGRTLPDPTDMPFACEHVHIDRTSQPAAFATSGTNTLTADVGVVSWNGPERYDIPVDVELDDDTAAPRMLDSAQLTNGQWQTQVTRSATGTLPLELDATFTAAQKDSRLGALGDRSSFTVDVRKRIEVHATSTTVTPGATVTLLVLTAGDGMANEPVSYAFTGAGSLSATGGRTDASGTAQLAYTAGSSGSATITATIAGTTDSDSVTLTTKSPCSRGLVCFRGSITSNEHFDRTDLTGGVIRHDVGTVQDTYAGVELALQGNGSFAPIGTFTESAHEDLTFTFVNTGETCRTHVEYAGSGNVTTYLGSASNPVGALIADGSETITSSSSACQGTPPLVTTTDITTSWAVGGPGAATATFNAGLLASIDFGTTYGTATDTTTVSGVLAP